MHEKDQSILKVEEISLNFGKVIALNKVSMEVKRGEVLGIIGPNGAGKTCLLNCINGFYRPNTGRVMIDGKDLSKVKTHGIAKMGVARTFQNIELFAGLSTLDNLMAARHILMKGGALVCGLFFGPARQEEINHRRVVEDVINLLELEEIRKKIVGTLPYGQRKRVDLARALCMEPQLLLLDEPMAGMNVEEKEDMARFILDIHELRGTCIILVEHNMDVVMDIVDRVEVLDFGSKIAEGVPEQIMNDPNVIRAYLGEE